MGFFDKLKSMANSLTGGGAEVSIQIEANDISDIIKIRATAVIGQESIHVDKVYLLVESIESIDIPSHEFQNNSVASMGSDNGNRTSTNVDLSRAIFEEKEYQIDGPQTLEAGKTYNWTYELKLSGGNIQPSYRGRFANHQWFFEVGLDTRGNDPDSGKVSCELR